MRNSRKQQTLLSAPVSAAQRERYLLAAGFALLAFSSLIVFSGSFGAYWRFDDGNHLDFATSYNPWQYFFDAEITRAQSGIHITPWNALFYDINLGVFGYEPRLHYAHLVAVIAATAVVTAALAYRFTGLVGTITAGLLFLCGMPTYVIANELMSGHYAYGLLFASTSVLLFLEHIRSKQAAPLLGSAALYLLACACKEIYVPLPLILFFACPAPLQQRTRAIAPFALIAVFYLGWRYRVLGTLAGAYEDNAANALERIWAIGQFLLHVVYSPEAPLLASLVLAAATVFGVAGLLLGPRRAPALLFACTIAAVLPLYVLAGKTLLNEPNRYLFVPWFLLSLLLGFVTERAAARRWGRLIIAAALVSSTATLTYAHRRAGLDDEAAFWDALYAQISSLREEEYLLLPPDRNLAAVSGLAHRFALAHAKLTGQPYRHDFLLTSSAALRDRQTVGAVVYSFDAIAGGFSDEPRLAITQALTLDAQRARQLAGQRIEPRPLSIELAFEEGHLVWEFGPYTAGRYQFFLNAVPALRPIARSGRRVLTERPLTVQILHQSAEGWSAISPELTLDPAVSPKLRWSGEGAAAGRTDPDAGRQGSAD